MCGYEHVVIFALFVTLLAPAAVAADDRAQLIRLNAQLQDRTKAYDVAAVSKMITDDYTLIGSSGRVYDRQAFLRDIGDRSAVWQVNEAEDVDVRFYNHDTALVTAVLHSRFRLNGKVYDGRVRYTDVWVRLGGAWKYAAGQATKLRQR